MGNIRLIVHKDNEYVKLGSAYVFYPYPYNSDYVYFITDDIELAIVKLKYPYIGEDFMYSMPGYRTYVIWECQD